MKDRYPRSTVTTVDDERDFVAGVTSGLPKPVVRIACLDTLAFNMERELRIEHDNIGAIDTPGVLLAPLSSKAVTCENMSKLHFCNGAFAPAIDPRRLFLRSFLLARFHLRYRSPTQHSEATGM